MKYFKKLEGERIYLSPMNVEDASTYTKWLNDFNVTDYLGASHKMTNVELERNYILNTNENTKHSFAIIDKEKDLLIGNCGFVKLDPFRRIAEIGIFIGEEEYRNNGYGPEALKLLIDYGFNYLNLNNIMLKVFSFNERAIKAYKKCGFKEFGKRHNTITIKNESYDDIYMEILRSDYYK